MAQNLCDCGNTKDIRSKRCLACKQLPASEMTEKTCTQCKITKPISEYRIRTRATPKPRSQCKECESKQKSDRLRKLNPAEYKKAKALRQWETDNPEKFALSIKKRKITSKGLTAQMDEILFDLDNKDVCSICGGDNNGYALHIDHCHITARYRGLLCSPCNLALGLLKDNVQTLSNAITYLTKEKS